MMPAAVPSQQTLADIGENVEDAFEETFLLFSQDLPSHDLGMIDRQASHVEVDVAGKSYLIKQSVGLLQSKREGGTTGAVVWRITPLVAGSGIAGLIGLAVAPQVTNYILTDQDYVMKLLRENISNNSTSEKSNRRKGKTLEKGNVDLPANLKLLALDWEHDSVENLRLVLPSNDALDLVVLCDCVYNSYLIEPLVQTCRDACTLSRPASTILVIGQQLRSDLVFEEWLTALLLYFNVWRVHDKHLPQGLRSGSGYVIHVAMLKS